MPDYAIFPSIKAALDKNAETLSAKYPVNATAAKSRDISATISVSSIQGTVINEPKAEIPKKDYKYWNEKHANDWIKTASGQTIIWGLCIPHGYFYGICQDVRFVARPVWSAHSGVPLMFWKNGEWSNEKCEEKHQIGRFLSQCERTGYIRYYYGCTKKPLPMLTPESFPLGLEEQKELRQSAQNHKSRTVHKVQKKRNQHTATYEYMDLSRSIYGSHIDYGTKRAPMTEKVSDYMDGKTTAGYRYLEPICPVKSGKRK